MSQRTSFPSVPYMVWQELAVRIVLITAFVITENVEPFWRQIQQEEAWLYKYPNTTGYVTTPTLYVIVITFSIGIITIFFAINKNYRESWEALLVPSLAIPLTGVITNLIKISVGRPRPDYFARCLPGVTRIDVNVPCTGNHETVIEGRKSFPSGHSSMAFCAMGFIALYTAGKLGVFNSNGRGRSWKLLVSLAPLVCSLLIAISRTSDYHHHWQDVTVGSIIGLLVVYLVYRQYYPGLGSSSSDTPYALLPSEDSGTSGYQTLDPTRRSPTSESPNLPSSYHHSVKNV